MAARTSLNDKILQLLTECEVKSEEFAYTVKEIAGEFEVSEKATFDALGVLEDAGKVNGSGRGLTSMWWLSEGKKEEAPKPKRTRRTKAQMEEARQEAANRTRYNANVAESQDMDAQYATPRVVDPNAWSEEALKDLPPVVPAEIPVIAAQCPIIAADGSTLTVPVDFDDPSKGRRELDMAKGERLLSEDTYRVRPVDVKRETARDEFMDAFRSEAPQTAEAVQALINKLQRLHNGLTGESAGEFTVTFHEPKNGESLDVPIPPLPAGVHPHTWELAHQGNTEGARRYHMRQAKAQETAHAEHIEAMAESRKAVENDTPPF